MNEREDQWQCMDVHQWAAWGLHGRPRERLSSATLDRLHTSRLPTTVQWCTVSPSARQVSEALPVLKFGCSSLVTMPRAT